MVFLLLILNMFHSILVFLLLILNKLLDGYWHGETTCSQSQYFKRLGSHFFSPLYSAMKNVLKVSS